MSRPLMFVKWSVLAVLIAGCHTEPPAAADPSAAAADEASHWPRFHGPKGNNISSDTGLLKEWPEQGPKLGFVAKGIGHGFAGVTIANGQIYTCGNIDGRTVITALDLDGNIQWQVENGPAWTGDKEGTRGTPTIDGDRLYHESPLGKVICLDAKTGKNELWSLNILAEFGSKNIRWALAESLLIDGDHLICCPGGKNTAVVALDKMTGETVWKSPSAGDLAGYGSPTLAEYEGLRMILTMTSKAVIGVGADTGDLLWQFEHVTDYDVNALKPMYYDGHVFISTGYGAGSVMLKIHVSGQKASVEEVWRTKDLDNHHGGVILLDGYLYGACHNSNNAKWVCLDWKTGELKYAERGVGKGSATCAEGMLYTMSERRDLGLVKATPNGHELISQFKIPGGGEGPTWAHPVVCGGRLYIRHGDFLYAYDVRAE